MSKAVWTIFRNGKTQTLQAARIRGLSLTKRATGEETLSITAQLDAPRFFYDEPITIFRSGVPWFSGRATQGDRGYSADEETIDVEFSNAFQFWTESSFVTSWNNAGEEQMVTRGFAGLGGDAATRADKQSVGKWLRELAERCRRLGADSQSGVIPFEVGDIDCDVYIPPVKLADLTWAGALQKIQEMVPELVVYWGYRTYGPPIINMKRAADLPTVTLALGSASFKGRRFVTKILNASRARMTPRGVAIVLRKQVEKPEKGENGETLYTTTYRTLAYPPRVKAGWRNVVTLTMDESLDATQTRWETPPDLAKEYFRHLSAPTWAGSISVVGEDPLEEIAPGNVLNITNSLADFASMRAVIQSVTHDVVSGVSTAQFGPADSLGFDSFRQLLAFRRKRRAGLDVDEHHVAEIKNGESTEATYGFGEDERPAKEGRTEVAISWCDNGQERTATFYVSGLT